MYIPEAILIEGDTSGCSQPLVGSKTKVVFQYMGLILKRNSCVDDIGRVGTT